MNSLLRASRTGLKLGALLAGLLASALPASAAVNPTFTASRTSGVAPLAVHFDATATTSTLTSRPFHDVHFSWNYGDSTAGTWATNGKSKNHDTGAIGAHVFETPGIYTVTLTARDSTGTPGSATVQITVQDPNVVFSGTNTICFSKSGNFSGAPTGALQAPTSSTWDNVMAALGTGKRVLLRRGEVWTHTGNQKAMTFNGPGILGAFGTGARPILRFTSSNHTDNGAVFMLGTRETPNQFTDFRFMDLEIDGDGFERLFVLSQGTMHNVTFLRVSMNDGGIFILLGPDVLDNQNRTGYPGHTLHSGVAIVETEYDHIIGNGGEFNGRHIAYMGVKNFTFLGNDWNDAELGEHILRLPIVSRAIVAHNRLTNSRAAKHLIKLHGSVYTSLDVQESRWVSINDNYFTSRVGDWYVSVGPQNTTSNEMTRDIVLDRNHVVFNTDGDTAFHIAANETTTRNNTVIMTAAGTGTAVEILRRGIEPPPANNRIYNNSAFNGGSGSTTMVLIDSSASNTTVRNNLGKGNGAMTAISGSGSGLVQSNNSMTATPGWVVSSPTTAAHFALASGSAAINAGATVPVFGDYAEATRPIGGAWDRGAFEFNSGGGGSPVVTITATASVSEPSVDGQFTITASPTPSSPITVNLNRTGTATMGIDYSTLPSTVSVPTTGTAVIGVTVYDDALNEGAETVTLNVTSGSGYTIGTPNSGTMTIAPSDTGGNLLAYGTFEPNQTTVLADMGNPHTVNSGALGKWFGRVGSVSSQNTTYQTSGSNHYITVGGSGNTNGTMQIITWPGAGTRQISFKHRGSNSQVRIYGANTGNTINKFDGGNTLTLVQTIGSLTNASWTTVTQDVTLTGSYNFLVIALRGGDFDDVSIAP